MVGTGEGTFERRRRRSRRLKERCQTRSNTEPLIEIISTRFASIYANGQSFVHRSVSRQSLPTVGNGGKIRGLRARLAERPASSTDRICQPWNEGDRAIGIGNRSSCDEFYLDTLKRPYCSINSDNLRRGPRSVTLVTFFSCLPIVLLPLSAFIYVLTLLSSPLLFTSPLLSSLLSACFRHRFVSLVVRLLRMKNATIDADRIRSDTTIRLSTYIGIIRR